MICSIFINIIFFSFPIICYCIYLIYNKTNLQEENDIFFDLAIFMSFYLCSEFGRGYTINLFLIYIPLILALQKKRYAISIVLGILISVRLNVFFNINFYVLLINSFLIILASSFKKFKIKKVYAIFESIFTLIIIIYYFDYIEGIKILFSYFITYFLIILVNHLWEKYLEMLNVFYSLKDVIKEKKLYESLFKITHEIKNPLAVCKGYLDMFDIENKTKANKYIGIVNQEINRTLELLKDFSDVSKTINIKKSNMDITLLIEDVCDEAQFIFNGKEFNFFCEFDKNEKYINGDYNRLKQVLINMIKNAKESIKNDGSVWLKTKVTRDNYIISIKDNGCGMENSIKEKIGTPFFTTKKNGTGLGVCFSNEIIQKHNGSIKYFSRVGKGTIVKITIPLK